MTTILRNRRTTMAMATKRRTAMTMAMKRRIATMMTWEGGLQ